MELSSASCSGGRIYIYKEDSPLLSYIFNTVIYLYHYGLICLFYTLGYNPVLYYLVAEIVSALVGTLSAWLLCSFDMLLSFCFFEHFLTLWLSKMLWAHLVFSLPQS